MPRPFWKNISIPHFRTATMPVIFSVYLYRRISNATLFADPGKLIRILDNLLGNAAKYAPAGTKITLSAAPSADLTSLRISVTDEGPGIPPEDLERIFNRTYTVSSARTPGSATGSGLGLAIVKTITERHGGTVSCENASGAGSIFSVTLPAKFLQS